MADNQLDITVKVDAQGAISTFDNLGNKVSEFSGKADDASSRSEMLGAAIGNIAVASGALLAAMVPVIAKFAEQGDKVNDVTEGFNELTAKAGGVSDVFLGNLRTGTQGMISDFELMRKANDALIAGLKPEQFETVAAAAKQFADKTGIDATQAIDQLSNALQTGNQRVLKQYQVFLDTTAVTEQYATAHGKLASQITETEKVEAIRAAALVKLAQNTKSAAEQTLGLGDRIDQLKTSLTNAINKIAAGIDQSKFLAQAFEILAKSALWLSEQVSKVFSDLDGYIRRSVARTLEGVNLLAKALSLNPITQSFGQDLELATRLYSDYLWKLDENIQKEKVSAIATNENASALQELAKQADEAARKSTDVVGGIERVGKAARDAEPEVRALKDATESLGEFGPGNAAGIADFMDQQARAAEEVASFWGQAIGQAMAQGIGAALSGDKGGIKNALRGLGSSAGGRFGATAGASIGGPIGAAIGQELGSALGDAAGKAVFDAVNHIFSSEDAGTSARKAADKWFADIFDASRLSVIINGELKQISDLTFGSGDSFGSGEAFNMFNELPAQAQAAFSGVGLAFEQLVGMGEDAAGQLAAVFANNLGGDLNNLQLLVQATGQSFDDLKGSIMDAFLNGKISAAEAQGAIGQLQVVMQDGIPGAVGAVTEAFDHLKAAGTKGGRALVDAIKDVGFEAKELGLKTLPDLQSYLASTGKYSAEEIQKVMDALNAAGITTIDQLTAATNDQLLPVLAQLENTQFPFAEAAEDVNALIEKVNKLPKEIETRVKVKVETEYDDSKTAELYHNSLPASGSSNYSNASTQA